MLVELNFGIIIKVYFEAAYENRIRIYLQQSCAASGSMNGGSNTKVTKSESVHYAFSATYSVLFPSDCLENSEGECMSQDEAE